MTGVIEGSGGTGLLEGSRPGTGVEGGTTGPPTPLLIGVAEGVSAPVTTASFTALTGPALYLAAMTTGTLGGNFAQNTRALSGMGLTWTPLSQYYYDATGGSRSRLDVFWAFGEATDGAITATGGFASTSQGFGLVVFAVEGGDFPLNLASSLGNTNPWNTAVPVPEENETVIVIHGLVTNSVASTLDPAFTLLGESPDNAQTVKTFVEFHKPPGIPATNQFGNGSLPVYTGGATVLTITALPIYPYSNTIAAMSPNARYPLRVKGTAPNIDGYVTEISKPEYTVNARYPGQVKGTSPGGVIPNYDALLEGVDLGTTFYAPGASKGTGSDPGNYDALIEGDVDTTFYAPGVSKGTGADPGAYDAVIAPMDQARYVPGDSITDAPAILNYDEAVAAMGQLRWYPNASIPELPAAILALNPVSYWRMDDAASPAVDQGTLGQDAAESGTIVWQGTPGPDGFFYPTFDGSTGYLSAGDANEYSINTVDGTTFTICFNPSAWTGGSGSLLLGKFKVSDNEWIIRFDSTDGSDLLARVYNTGQAFAFVGTEITAPIVNLDAWNTLVIVFPVGDVEPVMYLNTTTATPSVDVGVGGTREPDNTGPLTIGGSASSAGSLTGSIGNVAVFDYELSPAEVATIIDAAVADGFVEPLLSRTIRNLGPSGYWKLDDLDIADIADSSGNGLDGSGTDAVVARAEAGPDGKSYARFNNDEYGEYSGLVTIPGTGGANFSPDGHGLTVVALMKPDNGDLAYAINKNSVSVTEWNVNMAGHDWRSDTALTGNDMDAVYSDVQFARWQLVVFRWEDQTDTSPIPPDGFINSPDPLLAKETYAGTGSFVADPAAIIYLGANPSNGNYYAMNGAMAHVAVFNSALTDAEIETIYNAADAEGWITLNTLDEAIEARNPAGWWKLDETSGTTAVDYGYVGADGTYTDTFTLAGEPGPDGNDYVTVAGAGFIQAADDFSFSRSYDGLTVLMFKKDDNVADATQRYIMGKATADASNEEWALSGHAADGTSWFSATYAANGTLYDYLFEAASPALDNSWQLIASVWETTMGDPRGMRAYVDNGAAFGTIIESGSTAPVDGPGPVTIGKYLGAAGNWSGAMAHAVIANRPFGPGEIQQIQLAAERDGWFV